MSGCKIAGIHFAPAFALMICSNVVLSAQESDRTAEPPSKGAPGVGSVVVSADATRVSLELADAPLHQSLQQIAAQAGFVLRLRGPLDVPVTLSLEDASLRRALSILLGDRTHVMRFAPAVPGEPRRPSFLLVHDFEEGPSVTIRPATAAASPKRPADGALDDERRALRDVARTARLQAEEAVAELRVELQLAESPQVRQAVVLRLGQIGTPSALQALDGALRDPSPMVRSAALRELGAARGHDAASKLADVLRHRHEPGMRVQAARHLGNHRGAHARRALRAALDDPDPTVRSAAEASLSFWNGRRG